ncbi:uncharacterized protein BP5553_07571 [Venustampulla echinocandica]|uniref:Pinin/SDK/MemA protein domain-containing protein n=1 Tax=Venustampulla echinocandica TaxID=2656787 RepID=A0A370TGY2_9HELO|nr:uncharacterized protein BP5553_07571 [Venustampulla echinocandica]RDL34443.1 hypothetical protein BP5553_07571 [Venustampulla echinocandica]
MLLKGPAPWNWIGEGEREDNENLRMMARHVDLPIASVVVLPDLDLELEVPKSPGIKRRLSSEPESLSKRPRVSEGPDGNETSPTTLEPSSKPVESQTDTAEEKPKESGKDRPKSSAQEERKRGQRLFGGLLSTLSQTTPNGPQRRRQEIEKRQQEKAKHQKAEDEGRRAEKLASLKAARQAGQIKFNERSVMQALIGSHDALLTLIKMRIRHSNMLAMAHFLCTKTEPKLYFKPWELLPEEEDRIKTQIAEVETLIKREVEESNQENPHDSKQESYANEETNIASKETVGEPGSEYPSVSKPVGATNDTPVQVTQFGQVSPKKHALEEHNGEVVVENEEDTVIY